MSIWIYVWVIDRRVQFIFLRVHQRVLSFGVYGVFLSPCAAKLILVVSVVIIVLDHSSDIIPVKT